MTPVENWDDLTLSRSYLSALRVRFATSCLRYMSCLSASAVAPVVAHLLPCFSPWSSLGLQDCVCMQELGLYLLVICAFSFQRPPLDLFSRNWPILCVAMGGAGPLRNSRAHGEVWAFSRDSRLTHGGDVCVWRACGGWVECKSNEGPGGSVDV